MKKLAAFYLAILLGTFLFMGVADSADKGPVQDVFIFAPDQLDPGSNASFRVIVKEAVSLDSSQPVSGARVRVILEGPSRSYELIDQRTGYSGTVDEVAKIPEVDPEDDYKLVVKVRSNLGDVEKSHDVEITPRYRVLLTTDKPLYQPGQLIHIRAVSLRLSDLEPQADEDVTIEVEDPQGNKVFKKIGETDEYGIFAGDFQLADEIRHGQYLVRAIVGGKESEKEVTVKKYVLPKFKVVLDTEKDFYRPGEVVEGTVSADYFFGKPVSGGKVTVVAKAFDFEFHTVAEVKGRTDDDGDFEFSMTLPDYFAGQPLEKGDAFVMIEAKVEDQAEHVEEAAIQRTVASADLRLDIVPEAGRLIPGVENMIYAVVATPDGEPVEADVKIKAGGKTYSGRSDETGVAEIMFTPDEDDFQSRVSGYNNMGMPNMVYGLMVEAIAEDNSGREVTIERELSSDSLNNTLLLRTGRAMYTAGEDMKVEILTTRKTGSIYLDVIKNRRTVLTRSLDVRGGRVSDRVAIPADLFGTLEVHAYMILPSGEIMRDSRVVYVEQQNGLNISVSLDRDTYKPGETATLLFKVTDEKGRAVPSALGLSIVDESVFAIQEMKPGLLKVYFTLEKELMKPRYEVHLSPGGRTPEDIIQEKKEARGRRDKVMKVLTAGISDPTKMGWQENPAEARMDSEKMNLQQYAYSFGQWARDNQFLEKHWGEYRYISNVTEKMIDDKVIDKNNAIDSFGNYYSPDMLTSLSDDLNRQNISKAAASYRLMMVYSALQRFSNEKESWVDKLFEGTPAPAGLGAESMKDLLDMDYLKEGHAIDPWGNAFVIKELDEERASPYSNTFRKLDIRSAGPDGKAFTEDDVTDPYYHYNVPYLGGNYGGRMFFENEGMMKRALRGAGDMMLAEEATMPAMDMAAQAPAMMDGEVTKSESKDKSGGKPVRVREYFPETLLWQPSLITDRTGLARLEVPMADSITTWRMTALAHSRGGLLGSSTEGIRVFQDFFVDIDFPVALTQGDEVEIPVAVYNYLESGQVVKLEVRDHKGFELMSDATQRVRLKSGEIDVRYFRLKADKVGKADLTVYAVGDKMSDAIKRSVEVVPDGMRIEVVKNGRITGPLSETIDIPDYAISDASRVMAKVYPGVFAQVLEGMDGIFRMPNGCFEQTTSTTYPNIMVLAYMKKTDTISPEIQMKAESFINIGYQRLLSFEVDGGGFEWFGRPPAHKVLTAYGLMEFHDMSKVYPIDEAVIRRTQRWLADKQEKDGSWKPAEHWMETLSGDAFSRSVELNTAYITWALADTGYDGDAVEKGVRYLKDNLREIDDAYTLALAVNAIIAADPDDREGRELLRRLDGIKVEDPKRGTAHWEPKGQTAVHGSGNPAMIETTSLIAYAMIKANTLQNTANKALAWISQQKDAFGTFQTTQATVLSLKALLAAEEGKSPDVNADLLISMGGRRETVKITPETSDVLRQVDFKDQTMTGGNTVKIEAPEDVGLMYQVVGIYYVPWDKVDREKGEPILSLDVDYDRKKLKTDDILTAKVKAVYNGQGATDMVILDLGIPPGFQLVPDNLEKLKRDNSIEKYNATGRQITVYVRRMEAGEPLEFSYGLKAKFPVKAQAPKSAAYEYYNPENRSETKPEIIEVTK